MQYFRNDLKIFMKENSLVSIIVPNYNSAKFIGATIESVIAQTYTNWELVIIDDHSTDGSQSVIQNYAAHNNKIRLLSTQKNSGGPATPRNIGIEAASGEYIAFLDSDDTWFPRKLEYHLTVMQRENCLFSSTYRNTFRTIAEIKSELKTSLKLKVYEYQDLLRKNLINTSAVVIHKSLIGNLRFNTSQKLIAIEDFDFWLNILKKHQERIIVFGVETINYRITGTNISKSKFHMAKKFIRVVFKHEHSYLKTLYYFMNYFIISLLYQVKNR